MASHEVTIRENTGATKDAAPYLGNYASKETVRLEAGSGQMSAKCGLPPIQVLAILSGCFEAIEALERESLVRVHTDIGVICGVITGSFPTADAPFDRERNSLQLALRPDDSIRLSLVNAVPAIVNDGTGTKVRLGNIMDLETHRPMNVIHGQKPFRVAGFNMVLDDEGAGVYLQNNIGVTFPVTVDEVTSRQLFTAHVAVAVEAGDYKLYVKSRGGDPEGVLQTTFRKVKCLAAAPVGIRTVKAEDGEDGIIQPDERGTLISGWGLKDGFVSLRVAYAASDGTTVDEAIDMEYVDRHTETEILFPPATWGDFAASPAGDVVFTVTTAKGSASFTAKVA